MANTEEKSPREKASDAFRAMLAFLEFLIAGKVPEAVDPETIAGLQAAYATNQAHHNPDNLPRIGTLYNLVKAGEAGLTQPTAFAVAVEALCALDNDEAPPSRFTVKQFLKLSTYLARMMKAGAVFGDDATPVLAAGADVETIVQWHGEAKALLSSISNGATTTDDLTSTVESLVLKDPARPFTLITVLVDGTGAERKVLYGAADGYTTAKQAFDRLTEMATKGAP